MLEEVAVNDLVMNELNPNEFFEDTLFCPHCTLPLYQKDDKRRIFLFICRVCGYESNLDYEFTWEHETVNGISILPNVKQQDGDTCLLNAMLTIVESQLMRDGAVMKKKCSEKLSVDDMIKKYEDLTGFEFGEETDQSKERINICRRILYEQGVITTEGKGPYKAQSFWKSGASFDEISELLTKSVLLTNIPVTNMLGDLSPEDIYVADKNEVTKDLMERELWHAIVIVGFGSRRNEKYFRFMNSWGLDFCDKGFGSVRALEIKKVLFCKLKH